MVHRSASHIIYICMSTNYVIHQAIFIVLPDAKFPKHGVGATSQILYRSLFREYKCLFIMHWDSKNLHKIIKKVNDQVFGHTFDNTAARSTVMNREDLTAEIDATMAAMEMAPSESDLEPLSEPDEDHNPQAAPIGPAVAAVTTTGPVNIVTTAIDLPAPVPDSVNKESQQLLPVSAGCGQGRGRGRS